MAAGRGLEPRFTAPKAAVLPLNEPASKMEAIRGAAPRFADSESAVLLLNEIAENWCPAEESDPDQKFTKLLHCHCASRAWGGKRGSNSRTRGHSAMLYH